MSQLHYLVVNSSSLQSIQISRIQLDSARFFWHLEDARAGPLPRAGPVPRAGPAPGAGPEPRAGPHAPDRQSASDRWLGRIRRRDSDGSGLRGAGAVRAVSPPPRRRRTRRAAPRVTRIISD